MEKDREVMLGNLYGFDGGNFAGNLYDRDALSPVIRTYQGGNQQPLVMEAVSTNGSDVSGTIQASYHKNGERNVLENLKSGKGYEGVIVSMRGRNPDNPSDRRAGIPLEQRLEVNEQGICNCLTSVQKDNLVMEALYDFYNDKLREDRLCGTITANGNMSSTHCGTFGVIQVNRAGGQEGAGCGDGWMGGGHTVVHGDYHIRIRKLTPLECWRLMDFSDGDFLKAEAVSSNTQLYRQAGNSIVRNVLVAVIGQMFEGCGGTYRRH